MSVAERRDLALAVPALGFQSLEHARYIAFGNEKSLLYTWSLNGKTLDAMTPMGFQTPSIVDD